MSGPTEKQKMLAGAPYDPSDPGSRPTRRQPVAAVRHPCVTGTNVAGVLQAFQERVLV